MSIEKTLTKGRSSLKLSLFLKMGSKTRIVNKWIMKSEKRTGIEAEVFFRLYTHRVV
jgi:hypothetical protein